MVPPGPYPPAEADITPALIRSLLAEQHADLSERPLGESFEGWDNRTTRLGPDLAVRMPRISAAATLLEREIEWLPRLSTRWSFAAPVPVREGRPGSGYPWPWAVVPWFDGVDASVAPLSAAGAEALARAMREIHVRAPAAAPSNPWRTTPLAARREDTHAQMDALDALARREGLGWKSDDARALWARAAALPWAASHWVHADIHVKNLVTRGGGLAAILDWGDSGAGDPAQDIGQLWLLCGADDAERALAAYGSVNEDTLERARGEALASAVRLISTGDPAFVASGWQGLVALGVASGRAPAAASAPES